MSNNSVREKNRNFIEKIINASGGYVFSLASTFTNDDELIYEISYNSFIQMLDLSSSIKDENSFVEYITKTVRKKAEEVLGSSLTFTEIEKTDFHMDIKEVDITEIEKQFNDPKSQNIIFDTISTLSQEKKEVIFRVYFCDETIDDIANEYQVSSETINNYLLSAQKEIDEKTKSYFRKHKILDADYSRMFLIYSGIKFGKDILTKNVQDILIDKVMDNTITKAVEKGIDAINDEDTKDEKDETTLEEFITKVLKDLFGNWLNDGIKGAIKIGLTKAKTAIKTAKGVVSSTATKSASSAGIKAFIGTTVGKTIVTVLSVAVIGTSGVTIAHNVEENHYAQKFQDIENSDILVSTEGLYTYKSNNGNISDMPFDVAFYSEKDEIEAISLNITLDNNSMSETELKAYEAGLALISGIDVSYEKSDDGIKVNAILTKKELNYKLIEFLENNNFINSNTENLINEVLNANPETIIDILNSYGYNCE